MWRPKTGAAVQIRQQVIVDRQVSFGVPGIVDRKLFCAQRRKGAKIAKKSRNVEFDLYFDEKSNYSPVCFAFLASLRLGAHLSCGFVVRIPLVANQNLLFR
jgi:hypothetical protein